MARPRLLVASSGRLERLDALLVAAGAARGDVAWLDDALELFSLDVADGAILVADLAATPIADAGLLRRWLDAEPSARILWIGDDSESLAAFAAAGAPGEAWSWPLDLDQLGRLACGALEGAPATPLPDEVSETSAPVEPTAQSVAESVEPEPPSDPVERANGTGAHDPELSHIERILGGDAAEPTPGPEAGSAEATSTEAGPIVPADVAPSPQPRSTGGSPYEAPRAAFLAAPQPAPRAEPVAASTAPVAPGNPVDPAHDVGGAPLAAAELETRSVDPLAPDPLGTDPLGPDPLATDEPLLTEEEIEAFFSLETPEVDDVADEPESLELPSAPDESEGRTDELAVPAETDAEPEVHAADAASLRPAWLKDQVSDLADIVQTLDLRARANHSHLGIDDELARLRQFTRTIGYVAAPPPRGEQEFDLAVLVEEQLGALAGHEPDAPRLLFRRSPEGTTIRADKLLVTMALDALLHTAVRCAGPGDVVRVSVESEDRDAPIVRVRFPAGPLRDVAPNDVLQPYALKGLLPAIGPNALAAAGAIAVGQDGDLVLVEESEDVRVFEVSFSDSSVA